ncbi:FAD-dependent pyridine nucleotide-disulfide oxidoreductase [Colletotrichum kahawae]|uniref:FAD-dependent pyridine nucleotide-disulfide oxidoreductase n=1 Tax=Colletotrichum kahawae TaxID=34407 RepID=A0AAD9YKV1_COLKA|nr:FAD-dependent pyridine nucleotide-disulfide oxidoreductase [Colletotrichum kahawae]
MSTSVVIIGAGFAGVWSALSATHIISLKNKSKEVNVVVIAPEPTLVIRPRLYESNAADMSHPLTTLFQSVDIHFVQGTAESIDGIQQNVQVHTPTGEDITVNYSRLIIATGSRLNKPQSIDGLEQHAFDIDTLNAAARLERHLESLASSQQSAARDTVVICGAGFTGIELATELPKRLGHIDNPRIVLVESAKEVGPELGPGPRPIIQQALEELHIEVKLGSAVSAVDTEGVILASGERIATNTVVWTAGMRATPLAQQTEGSRDSLGRLHVDRYLQTSTNKNIFATGDASYAIADSSGHHALMSCQHALQLGRVSGHNAAAALLGEPMIAYSQAAYNCCLDLGAWGAVIGEGWERKVKMYGDLAKRIKTYINQTLIYPPVDAKEALAMASPLGQDSDELFKTMLEIVS